MGAGEALSSGIPLTGPTAAMTRPPVGHVIAALDRAASELADGQTNITGYGSGSWCGLTVRSRHACGMVCAVRAQQRIIALWDSQAVHPVCLGSSIVQPSA